jgi:YfiH family protein
MFFHTAQFSIYFGTATDNIYPSDPDTRSTLSTDSFALPALHTVANTLSLTNLTLLHQVHGTTGFRVEHDLPLPASNLFIDGDYLVSTSPQFGLGTFTADCLPLICYDQTNHALGIAHAGWKGALAGIATTMLEYMHQQYGTTTNDVTFFFGPSARRCCYEIQQDFVERLEQVSFKEKVLEQRSDRFYFDLPDFVNYQLIEHGVPAPSLHQTHNLCTICDTRYFSHRRQGSAAGRNITIAALRAL